jgi:hypothetical protein
MSDVTDWLDLDMLLEQYSDPQMSLEKLSAMYGASCTMLYRRLAADRPRFDRALVVRARRLHDLAVSIAYATPERQANGIFGDRIDPGSVAMLKLRSDIAARQAAVLDATLSERSRVDVQVDASPLSDMIKRIAAHGSTIPISTCAPLPAIEGEYQAVDPSDM